MNYAKLFIVIIAANGLASIIWPTNVNTFEYDNHIKISKLEKVIRWHEQEAEELRSRVYELKDLLNATQNAYEIDTLELALSKSKYVYVDHASLNKSQFKEVIANTLKYLGLYSEDAVHLLMVTAAVETDMGHLNKQMTGPALGIFQILPSTEAFLLKWLDKYPELKTKVMALRGKDVDGVLQLRVNVAYQVAMSILVYLQRGSPIPNRYEHAKIIEFYRKNYNTNSEERVIRNATNKYNLILKMDK